MLAWRGAIAAVSLALATSGCQSVNSAVSLISGSGGPAEGQPGHVAGFLGGAVADEPQAALLGRQVLSAGGNAADAAAAMGMALSVTLPSRASLGSGGACLSYIAGSPDAPQAVIFTSVPPATRAGADRPAAVPMLARGMFALQNRFGHLPFEQLLLPVETMARQGVHVSRAFVRDLAVVAGPLAGDPGAAAVFYRNGRPLAEGELMVQPDLAATLAQLRLAGVGDLYLGDLARRLVAAAPQAGASLSLADLRAAVPKFAGSLSVGAARGDKVAFLPPPADGGLAAAAAFQVLQDNPADTQRANARGLAVASRWRQGGTDVTAIAAATDLPPANLPPLPASTTFGVIDRDGDAAVCAVTMGNLFGTGRIASGTGILLAASPNWLPPPLLAAAIAYDPDDARFHALVGGSGQAGAPLAVAMMISQALGQRGSVAQPTPGSVPDPGRANVIACSQYLPKSDTSCAFATDPRGFGLATGGGG
jgi:gamma-glutamyltranspeptidase/glutathione hydrolase